MPEEDARGPAGDRPAGLSASPPRTTLSPIRRREFAEPDRAAVQESIARAVEANPDRFLDLFRTLPQSMQGRFVAADLMKETFEPFAASKETRNRYNGPVHNSAAVLADEQLRRVLAEPKEPGRDFVVMITGMPGSGKTTMVLDDINSAPLVGATANRPHAYYEGQLADPKVALDKMRQVVQAGFRPEIVAVLPSPDQALNNTLKRFEENGRGASIQTMARLQAGLPEGLRAIQGEFGDRIGVTVIDRRDNLHPKIETGWDAVKQIEAAGDYEKLLKQLTAHLEYRRPELTDAAYRQAAGLAPVREAADSSRKDVRDGEETWKRSELPRQVEAPALLTREEAEAHYTRARIYELRLNPVRGVFDADHLREINRRIFQDLPAKGYEGYSPGEFRPPTEEGKDWIKNRELKTVGERAIVAYSPMDQPARSRIDSLLASRAKPDELAKLKTAEFTKAIAELYIQLDYLHPYQDGNSRTLREFTRQLSAEAGYQLDWERFDRGPGGRDTLYIARDLSVNAIAAEEVRTEHTRRLVGHMRAVFSENRALPDLLRDALRPSRAVAFERLPESEAVAQHPELKSVYEGWRRIEDKLAARFPADRTSRDKYLAASRAEIVKALDAGGPLSTPTTSKATLIRDAQAPGRDDDRERS
jgi:cell filamentation protein